MADSSSENRNLTNGTVVDDGKVEQGIKFQHPSELAETSKHSQLHYGMDDNPSIHLAFLFGFQIALMNIVFCVGIAVLTAQLICADQEFAASLYSTTAVMSGISTMLQTTLGVSFQKSLIGDKTNLGYIIKQLQKHYALTGRKAVDGLMVSYDINRTTLDNTSALQEKPWISEWNKIQGSLMVASLLQIAIGFFGLASLILRLLGPLQICCFLVLMGVTLRGVVSAFAEIHWGMSMLSIIVVVVFARYVNKVPVPLPSWSRQSGFQLTWFPLFELFPVLLTIIVCWIISHILTVCGVFPDDPTNPQYNARTDFASESVQVAPFFRLPYPGQYGSPGIKISNVAMLTSVVFLSSLESVGDYVQFASACQVTSPPPHAVNRGILTEGLCSLLSGAMGAGHATTSYSNTVGIIGITKVANRRVYNIAGFLTFLMGICGKLGTALVAIPKPVLAGPAFISFALIVGTGLSNLRKVDLTSARNEAILGISIMGAVLISTWVGNNPTAIDTGFPDLDQSITAILGMHFFVGLILAIFLELTLPANRTNRFVTSEEVTDLAKGQEKYPVSGVISVYNLPSVCRCVSRLWIANYLPFLPYSPGEETPVF